MKRFLAVTMVVIMLALSGVPAFAHNAGPCNDSNGDGSSSGQEYAQHHIVAAAKDGALGNDGHKPGNHQGYSACVEQAQSGE